MMDSLYLVFVSFLMAFVATLWMHPKVLKIAIMKNLVDNPDHRKLQRRPTPVMGGIAVFFGMLIGMCSSQIFSANNMFIYLVAMMIMLYVGTIDDILDLSPRLRFALEITVVVILILVTGNSISDFFGLWGVYEISIWLAAPLTVLAAVGIINAINLIDGVNGLSTGFCVMACTLFAILFYMSGNITMAIIAMSAAGAIVPFFMHNVFGNDTRMFIGDGGALVMGIVMSIFVMNVLDTSSMSAKLVEESGVGLIPFCVAVLSVPVFDTLRVMSTRIIRGTSPFNADKTHLHHLFIDLGFSHIGTTISILTLNTLVVACWFLSFILGASIDVQLYVVLVMSVLVTFVFYGVMRVQIRKNGALCRMFNKVGKFTFVEKSGAWAKLEKIIDSI
ncbi:MAG: undecaprenyl/decaprenyl-phosphate alpha-N-acetylglucosaminyl 1-phosphate transferase [Bacteroidaceae bacterium]|nr:undecaprenyl/decaprenyl-phosphate alpha-N-acetylglucosaminyl 1-phosphate transferase [Bacteroidaceae bacterium]